MSVRCTDTLSERRTRIVDEATALARLRDATPWCARCSTARIMPITRFITTPLSNAFDDLQHELVRLDMGWTCDRERASLRHTTSDIRHHVCAALAWLDDLPPEVARYDRLDGEARILAHEAFLAVLALGQLLLRAIEDRLANEVAIARAQCAVEHMLDVLAPFVSRADDALRRVLLEDVSIESALDGVGHGH